MQVFTTCALSGPGTRTISRVDLYLEGYIRINKAPFPTTDGAALSLPRVQGGVYSVSVYLPDNFDRYNFTEDNQVTIKLQYMQDNMTLWIMPPIPCRFLTVSM